MSDKNYLCGVSFTLNPPELISASSHFEAILKYYSINPACEYYQDTTPPSVFIYSAYEGYAEHHLMIDLILLSK